MSWYAVLPWSDTDRDFYLESEIMFRGEVMLVETTRIHENMDPWDDEGWYATQGYTYEFKLYAYSDLTGDPEVPVEDFTHEELVWLQKEIDELAADEAAAHAESKLDR